jgi:hypothetical protein
MFAAGRVGRAEPFVPQDKQAPPLQSDDRNLVGGVEGDAVNIDLGLAFERVERQQALDLAARCIELQHIAGNSVGSRGVPLKRRSTQNCRAGEESFSTFPSSV